MRRAGLFLLLAAMLSTTASTAQDKKDSPKDPSKEAKDPADAGKYKGFLPQGWKALGLSDAQKQEIYKKQATYKTRLKSLQEQIEKLKTEERRDLESVLTEDQKKQYRENLLKKSPK